MHCPLQLCSLRGSVARADARFNYSLTPLGRIGKNGCQRRYGNHLSKRGRSLMTHRLRPGAFRACCHWSSRTLSWAIVCCLGLFFSALADDDSEGDGTIGRSSFPDLVQLNSVPAPGNISDIPLKGHVIGLHLIQNDRTGERLVVGGGDDGSVAIWSLE